MINLKDFQINKEGSFSMTKPFESNQIIKIIKNEIKEELKKLVITDATACIGGDLVNFSKYFMNVIGVEIEQENFKLLIKNCKKFECKNVILFNQDYLEIYDKLKQDIIYIDPPWGGVEYKTKKEINLKLGNVQISQLINEIIKNKLAKNIFIKVPLNVSLENINYNKIETIYHRNGTESFKILII
jgi:tRNA/tmRNA/rRNA uracil-C5-methylase (TrmA/RlmC/RlmD family)